MSNMTVKDLLEVNDSFGGNPVMLTTSEGYVFEMTDSVFQAVCLKWADQLVVDMDETMADYAYDWMVEEVHEEMFDLR